MAIFHNFYIIQTVPIRAKRDNKKHEDKKAVFH